MAYIKDVQVGSDTYLIEPALYITPSKNGAAYTATLTNFSLITGATVQAKFATTNDANATLNVNSTGAKNIFYNNASITEKQFKANHIYTLVYDGTQWQVVGDIDTNNDYRTRQNVLADTDTSNRSLLLANPTVGTANNNTAYVTYRNDKIYANVNTGIITATGFNGNLTGDVTGNATTATTATNLSAAPTITSGGTATVNLVANTAYTLTVGGKSVIFNTPADNNTATATDNILDGSNSGTAITYAPYTAQQAKLSFDTSTTAPTRTDRLNLNGFLYATKYNVEGQVILQWNSTDNSLDFVFA